MNGEILKSEAKSTAAIVAVFNPDGSLLDNIALAAAQVGRVIVVDDGSTALGTTDLLDQLTGAGATVIRQASNGGIASALNAGIRAALEFDEVEFVLTLDQDSGLKPDYVQRCLETWKAAISTGQKVGFVAAERFDSNDFPAAGTVNGLKLAFDPLQSGCLLPRTTLEVMGLLDETLFIDGVDSEYTARNRAAGRLVLIGRGCAMSHSLGDRRQVRALGRPTPLSYNYHPPARVYYMARNGVVLVRRYWRRAPRWILRRSVEELKAHTLRLMFSPDRAAVALAIRFGLADAFRGRLGRIPDATRSRITAGGSA